MPLATTLLAKMPLLMLDLPLGIYFWNLRRKKRSPGYNPNLGGQIKKAGDFDSDAIRSALQLAMDEKLK